MEAFLLKLLIFLAAAAIRAAQGSSTVAIITTASIVAPMLGSMGLDSPLGRALCVLAIGAGSMVASHQRALSSCQSNCYVKSIKRRIFVLIMFRMEINK